MSADLDPGVYIEEVWGAHPIPGVQTSVAAFIGRATEGPFHAAVRLLSYRDFESVFGQPDPRTQLATQVRLFFQNGGSQCYVVRIPPGQGAEAFRGMESSHTGFHALDQVDIFNLMILPRDEELGEDDYVSLCRDAGEYCRNHRAFLLIDSPPGWKTANDVIAGARKLRGGVVGDSSAVFYPWLKVRERSGIRLAAPSGAIAGLIARMDASRGVWKGPAGIEAAIKGIEGLQRILTDSEVGTIYSEGVNCIRSLPVTGVVNWGARTLAGANDSYSEWKYIPVRRTALFIEESLYRGTGWAIFEKNDEKLWAEIRLNIAAFMTLLFREGAFQGKTPRDAYFVKCDGETTTRMDVENGIVNMLVGFAPVKPAEFVTLLIQQKAGTT